MVLSKQFRICPWDPGKSLKMMTVLEKTVNLPIMSGWQKRTNVKLKWVDEKLQQREK